MNKLNLVLRFALVVAVMMVSTIAGAQQIDPCKSIAEISPVSPACYRACPQGDTENFGNQGFQIDIYVRDANGDPVLGAPANDMWLINNDCDPANNLSFCYFICTPEVVNFANAHYAFIDCVLPAGGHTQGLSVVVQGWILQDEDNNCQEYCLPIHVRTPDINGDLVVSLPDFAIFASHYPPQPYHFSCDLDCSGAINLVDFSIFANHWQHSCN